MKTLTIGTFLRLYYQTSELSRIQLDNFTGEEMAELVFIYEKAKELYEKDYSPNKVMKTSKYVIEAIVWNNELSNG